MATDGKYEYIGNGSPDGVILGQSATEKIGFYGTAPVVQQEVPADVADSTHSTGEAATDINLVNDQLSALVAELVELGIISQA